MTNINYYGGMNMQNNPFSLSFGKEPKNVLKREQQFEMILSNYLQGTP